MSEYAIRGGLEGKRRLDVLAATLAPSTRALLERAGVAAGMRCLDVGTGGGHVARELARMTGPAGSVVGIDLDAEIIKLAQADAERSGVDNVTFDVGDARDLPPGEFDVVYARCLLMHLPDREQGARGLVARVRPGGIIVIEDIDWDGAFTYPRSTAFERFAEIHDEVFARAGADVRTGPKLPGLLGAAGADEIGLSVTQPVQMSGDGKLIFQSTLANLADTAIGAGLVTPAELDHALRELTEFTADPATILGWPRIFQVWGRRSA